MFNPNSANQTWSKWVWFVRPGELKRRPFENVRENIARFGRKAFGSASQMRITENARGYVVEVLTEGSPINDRRFREHMCRNWEAFFVAGFGVDTFSKMTAKRMAGSPQDGRPADQLLVLPAADIFPRRTNP